MILQIYLQPIKMTLEMNIAKLAPCKNSFAVWKNKKKILLENVGCLNAYSLKSQASEAWVKGVKALKEELGGLWMVK